MNKKVSGGWNSIIFDITSNIVNILILSSFIYYKVLLNSETSGEGHKSFFVETLRHRKENRTRIQGTIGKRIRPVDYFMKTTIPKIGSCIAKLLLDKPTSNVA